VESLLPGGQRQRDALVPDLEDRGSLATLGALDQLLGRSVEGGHDGVLAIGPGAAPLGDAATQDVTERPGRCADEADRADGRIADRHAQRDHRALAVPDDRGPAQVELATGAHRPDRVARVVDPAEEVAPLPVALRLAAAARVVAEAGDAQAGERIGQTGQEAG
jgi:hypothetical protein